MNTHVARIVRPALGVLCIASIAALSGCGGEACFGFDNCFNGNGMQSVTISGTAATGRALPNATMIVQCAQGSGSTLSDSSGHYSITFSAALPCALTATSNGTTLHSLAFSGGTFNTTPETELMLVYLASQLGTNVAQLIGNLAANPHFQQVLESQIDVQAAQSAVATNLQQHYSVTLTTPAFLTTPFVVGQAGVDTDLTALAAAGAIDTNGMPDPAAVTLLSQAGAAHPL